MISRKAFTLVELIVVIALFAVIISLSAPVLISQLYRNSAYETAEQLSSVLFSQQQKALSGENPTHEISFKTNLYTIEAETIFLPPGTSIKWVNLSDGGNRIRFNPGSLFPQAHGVISIASANDEYQVKISKIGLIEITHI